MKWMFALENERNILHGNWTLNAALVLLCILFLFAAFAPKEPYNPNPVKLHVCDQIYNPNVASAR